ncbi:MAG: class I SAM-dependent methyltransferase [Candidatus Thermoplasmatota archaeon]|nr:class I SAM-dependent methyltransferase [Candidatus Thermoplasmatota archaeon]
MLEEYEIKRSHQIDDFIDRISDNIYEEFAEYEDYHPAILGEESGQKLYDLIRHVEPELMVETGVCNGFSSSIILKAMEDADRGHLYSIDLPVNIDEIRDEEKTGAVLPPGKESGWAVPSPLRERWTLKVGNTYNELPRLFETLSENIGIFLHDSGHAYETMMFEFALAWRNLKEDHFLLADNIDFNKAFFHFTEAKKLKRYRLADMGLMIKEISD